MIIIALWLIWCALIMIGNIKKSYWLSFWFAAQLYLTWQLHTCASRAAWEIAWDTHEYLHQAMYPHITLHAVRHASSSNWVVCHLMPCHHWILLMHSTRSIRIQTIQITDNICDWACKNQPCERKLRHVIFSLISFVPNALSHFPKLQKKPH